MKALVISDVGATEFRDVPDPVTGPGLVKLRVRHVGLCGSDLNTWRGANPLARLPRVPGHEIGGVIEQTGSGVPPQFAPGARAVVIPYTTCGTCSACRKRRVNACRHNATLGVQQDGGMSDFLVVHHDRLIVNETLDAPLLALVEPLSVGFHAVARGSVTEGETVVVLGGGMIGVGAMLAAKERGATVIAVEPSRPKHAELLELGITHVIDPTESDAGEAVTALTGGEGADLVLEAVGLPETFRAAVDMACFAGRVVYVGYAKSEVSYNTALFNLKELDMFGSRNATRADFAAVIRFLEQNPQTGERLISQVFPWNEADQSFDWWERNRSETFKVMIEMPAG